MTHDTYTETHLNDLPTLQLVRTRTLQDFEVERLELRASGTTDEAARENTDYLLAKLKEIERK